MDLKQLSSFIAVADGNSFASAAQKNAITRSAVSHQIASLEEEIGADLFVRNNHDVQLTECGQLMLKSAKAIIKEAEDARDKIKGLRGAISGKLRIGVGSFVEPYIRRAAYRLLRDYPMLNIDVKIEQAKTLNERLRNHQLDIAFTLNDSYEQEHIESVKFIPINIRAIVRKTHDLASRKKVSIDELKKYQVIMPDEDKRSIQTIERFFGINIEGIKRRVVINNADAAFCAAEEEGFVTFSTPGHIVNRPNLTTIPVIGMEKEIMCNAHWMSDIYLKNSAKKLMEYIEKYSIPYYKSLIDV